MDEKPGSIKVTSKPSGANIYLDGCHKGKTPDTIIEVPPGHHTIKLTLDCYRDWTRNDRIINCGQGILIVSGGSNIIKWNVTRDNTIAGAGVRIECSATTTGIHENCFIDNVPQAWDDGTDNNWIGNYWSPPPGGSSNYIIPGATGSEDKDPLDECPMKEQST